jgi:hypothetical protein
LLPNAGILLISKCKCKCRHVDKIYLKWLEQSKIYGNADDCV